MDRPTWPKRGDIIYIDEVKERVWCSNCKTNRERYPLEHAVFEKVIPLPDGIPDCCDDPDYVYYRGTERFVTGDPHFMRKELEAKGVKLVTRWEKKHVSI